MKNNQPSKNIPSQVLLGLGVIGLGVLFLLDNLYIIEFRQVWRYWPVLIVFWGLVKLIGADTNSERFTFGLVAGLGVVLTLNRMGLAYFNVRTFWPLLLILGGGAVVYKSLSARRAAEEPRKHVSFDGVAPDLKNDSESVLNVTAILGGFERRITTPAFRGGEVTSIMAGCVLDLRGSSIEGEAVINVFAMMGGIQLKVPPDWTIVLQGSPILGGFEERTITPAAPGKRLVIKGYAIMGGVEVRN